MRIGIAARGISEKAGGAKEYIINLTKSLLEFDEVNQYFIFYDQKKHLGKFPEGNEILLKSSNKLIWDYIKLPVAIEKHKIDICLFPKNVVPFNVKCKSIVVILDLLHILNPKVYKWSDSLYMKLFIPISTKKADAIVTISESTKADLIKVTGADRNKIQVIHLAPDKKYKIFKNQEDRKGKILNKYNLKTPYILYVGSLSPRKNIPRLIQAYDKLKIEKNIPHSLVLAGGKTWKGKDIHQSIKQSLYQNDIILSGFISDDELPYLYNMADLLVYPSLYEGFGLPILEAQACGCPIVCSYSSSLKEVGRDSVHKVDPYSVEAIKNGIYKVISHHDYRNLLITKGFKNLKRFSWEKTANEILSLLNNI